MRYLPEFPTSSLSPSEWKLPRGDTNISTRGWWSSSRNLFPHRSISNICNSPSCLIEDHYTTMLTIEALLAIEPSLFTGAYISHQKGLWLIRLCQRLLFRQKARRANSLKSNPLGWNTILEEVYRPTTIRYIYIRGSSLSADNRSSIIYRPWCSSSLKSIVRNAHVRL